ncbi:hypothetical protein MAR_018689 [Mya arenaria]|uniref:Uncharacterized protein n=1 Tax=Mya arenaria TaxID=6604 RepID=A0ABY7EIW5_MYAAR|nr:hypothetical protein MAR_018689 [Mya arenaria]
MTGTVTEAKNSNTHPAQDAGAKEELDTAPNSYLETSFLLSTELENMGYNDVNRKKKQEIMIALDECVHMAERAKPNGNPRFNLAVGSQIECTALKDSDYDVLFGPSAEHVAAISTSNEMKDVENFHAVANTGVS